MVKIEFSTKKERGKIKKSKEACRVIYKIMEEIADGFVDGFIFDVWGNRIGQWTLDPTKTTWWEEMSYHE